MFNNLLEINPEEESKKIISFLKQVFTEQKIGKAVIGVSGGIDSAASLALLSKAIPKEDITALYLPYFNEIDKDIKEIENFLEIRVTTVSINKTADELIERLGVLKEDRLRRGNIMARVRMIILFDWAKKENGLVVGTENRSEFHLGYFTRYGDSASDIEPIQHLYKTQVIELAKHVGVPQSIMKKKPSADLWEYQTDESEFGFSYADADPVLFRFFDKKERIGEIEKDYPNARKIVGFASKNAYKHHVPYHL